MGRIMERLLFIEPYNFPVGIIEKVKYHYPHLSDGQLSKVMDGLREYFIVCAVGKFAYMPSRVIYVAWLEFSVFTELYDEFCKNGMGRYPHLTPAEAMSAPEQTENRINQSWYRFCWREHQDPEAPARLPSLYALDAELDIPDRFQYSLNHCVSRYKKYLAKYDDLEY